MSRINRHTDSTIDLRLPVDPAAIPSARHTLDTLGQAVPPEALQNAQLLVSELVTNSYKHADWRGRDWIGLKVWVMDGRVRVEVSDPGPGFNHEQVAEPPSAQRTSGWGLYLVSRLAHRWGVCQNDESCVWFELDLR